MRKRRLTNREQLRKSLKEAEPNSVLYKELLTIQISIKKPREKAVPELIKLLDALTTQVAKHFIAAVLGSTKDSRAIRPLMQGAVAPENENYSSNFLWPLEKFDCTKHLDFFVNFMLDRDDPGEAMLACGYVIAAMKGPFGAQEVKRNIRKLLAAKPIQAEPDIQLQAEHFRMGAADHLMEQYFLQVAREFHRKPIDAIDTSKTA
ncbi:MAG: hypothetical protein ACRYF0_19825 [Janthinobacterium lividum]